MSKKIHTIQSSDKKEFDKTVNQFLESGGDLMDGGYEVINSDDGLIYSQVIVFKNCDVEFYEDGQLKSVENKNEDGEFDGLYTHWYENGQKISEMTYKDGKEDGLDTVYKKNGQKVREHTYKDGKEIKRIDWDYHRNGQKISEMTYKDRKKDGKWNKWYSDGNKTFERTYKKGKKDGLWKFWYENGQKREEVTWKDGKRDGLWTEWYENGQKKEERTFKDGETIAQECWDEDGNEKECIDNY